MNYLEWVVIGFLVFLGIQFIFAPFIVWRTQRIPEKYSFRLLDPNWFLSARSAVFSELHEEIIHRGFDYIGSSELIMSDASMYFSIYNDFDKKLACTLVTAHSTNVNTTHIEFTQMYKDGSVLNVSNASMINVYPKSAFRLSFRFPAVNDIGQLLGIAEKLVSSNKKSEQKITFESGKEFETVELYLNGELDELMDRGWVQSAVREAQRGLTLKGAILMTWKILWPVKQILNYVDIACSNRALKKA